jgi:hypothetical protein
VSDWKFALLAIVKYDKLVEIVDEDIAIMDGVGISDISVSLNVIKKEKEETLRKYFPAIYDDYFELHKWRRLTPARWKRFINWIFVESLTILKK